MDDDAGVDRLAQAMKEVEQRELISYPLGWIAPDWFHSLWRRVMCGRGYHLLDEVITSTEPYHLLVCDACQLEVEINKVECGA
jgi:hypothetical protein